MQIEQGKRYILRNGTVTNEMKLSHGMFLARIDEKMGSWNPEGNFMPMQHPFDVVDVLDWKPIKYALARDLGKALHKRHQGKLAYVLNVRQVRNALRGDLDGLALGFDWKTTPQGYDYWDQRMHGGVALTDDDYTFLASLL